MKQKYLNNVKVIIIILIGVLILFAILGTFDLLPEREGMDDVAPKCSTLQEIDTCKDDKTDTNDEHSWVNSHKDSDWTDNTSKHSEWNNDNSYSRYADNDNYILKTKIVPPKSTACPTKISSDATKYLDSVSISNNPTSSSNISESSSNTSASSSNTSTETVTNTVTNTVTPDPPKQVVPEPIVAPIQPIPSFSEYNPSASYMLNTNTNTNDTKENKDNKDSCPPCPSCARCPEPAFDCKKVPNYRSSSIGGYLPMPVLTDFSKF
jgi:hypothetical protein